MNALRKISFGFLFILIFIVTIPLYADWPCRSDQSVPIATDGGNQWNVRLAGDGAGGAILVWQDKRNGAIDKLFVQHVNSAGNMLWQSGGIQLATSAGFQYYPQIIGDGQGGAFIVWEDNRNGFDYDIYAQKISPTGVTQWAPGGTVVCAASGHQYYPQIVPDGSGGIIVAWQDRRSGQYDIYAQRLDPNGQALWQQNGQPVCSASGDQIDPHLVEDGTGGAIVGWGDYRSGDPNVYAQRISAVGQVVWSSDGSAICDALNSQWNIQIVTDGAGGAIVGWQDRRSGTTDKIYAQRIDINGATKWPFDGVAMASAIGLEYYPRLVSDGAGGAVAVWQDNRSGTDYDIYAQRVNGGGQILWSSTGQPVCTASGQQYNPQVIKNGSSILVTWQDKRNGSDFDVYLQRFALTGSAQWTEDGVSACISPQDQFNPQLANDAVQGAVLAWTDYRGVNGFTDIYSQRIAANGKCAGGCYRTFTQDSFALKAAHRRLNNPLPFPNTGNVRDSIFYRGVYPDGIVVGIERQDSAKKYGWEYFSRSRYVQRSFTQNGTPRPFDRRYDRLFVGPLKNSTPRAYNNRLASQQLVLKLNIAASDVGLTEGQLGDLVFKDTSKAYNPLNGKSLRQIVNSVDSMLTYWRRYVYKGSKIDYLVLDATLSKINNAFTGSFEIVSREPLYVKPTKTLFSVPFLQPNTDPPAVVPTFQTQSFEDDLPEQYILSQNYPNPFNPLTTIEFNLQEPAIVTVKVFNILGQEVGILFDHSALEEGPQSIDFDATNLSSGVYFYQLIADPLDGGHRIFSDVKKMMLLK